MLTAASRTVADSDFIYSIKQLLMTLQFSSERALEVRETIALVTMVELRPRVNCERRGRITLSNRVGDDQ